MVTKDLAEQFRADELIQGIAEIIGGRGGGNPTLARAGSDKVEKLADALKAIYQIVEKRA
jgi:alanyl-tRNA synthetase